MANLGQLDLELPAGAPVAARDPAKATFGGFTQLQIVAGTATLLLVVWAMWVTNAIVRPRQGTIVAARLSGIVGDYVEAQRFSGAPPERVRLEMHAFMASLDKELQRRSAAGQIVLVGEAVLTKSVPDITDDLKKAVYASGVAQPRRASFDELLRMQQPAGLAALSGSPSAAPSLSGSTTAIDPRLAAPSALAGQPPKPAASVSSFGETGAGGD